jgi:hypothetical protein
LRKKYHCQTPYWAILLGIALAGLVNPMTYILFEARIYEASIIGGQFFLIGGIYFIITLFDCPTKPRFMTAGIFLACAVGTRTALLPAAAFLAFVACIWIIKSERAKAMSLIAAIAVPLMIGAILYAAYNYARFDSVAEFGLRYQLTSYNQYSNGAMSLAYIPPNLYKTLFNPFEMRRAFPYIFPNRWAGPAWLAEKNYPGLYSLYAESITGILIGSPFMIFAALAGWRKNTRWIFAVLAGTAMLSLFMLQVFFFTSMRYLLDAVPTLTLLAITGFWQGLDLLRSRPIARYSYAALGILLFVYGLIMSFTLSISAHFEQLRAFHPELLKQMTQMFNSILR